MCRMAQCTPAWSVEIYQRDTEGGKPVNKNDAEGIVNCIERLIHLKIADVFAELADNNKSTDDKQKQVRDALVQLFTDWSSRQ